MLYVGIMGGTFDPIHLGHLAAAEGARHLLGLDRVIFMPNRQPPHKQGLPVTPAEHRAAMVRLAIAGNDAFVFSDLELRREGPSYTVDTLRAVRALHPDWRIAFLIGTDSLLQIHTWHEYKALFRLAEVVAIRRPGHPEAEVAEAVRRLARETGVQVQVLTLPGVDVASSDLRQRAAQGYPLRYLVPDAVERYIREHRLYC
ncbi:MAG TPA: nicotinate-nucleotide adenylyltransferase [Symbiobacteriaceae bacterium]